MLAHLRGSSSSFTDASLFALRCPVLLCADDDTARFLYDALPLPASKRPSVKAIKVALEELRPRHGLDFERRVSDAWSLIAPPAG
jgi:hypothetical protein